MKIQERLEVFIQNKYNLIYTPQKTEKNNGTQFFNYFYSSIPSKNPEHTILQCFNILYHDGVLLKVIYSNLVEYEGGGVEGCCWDYPDMNSPFPEDRFEGVRFEIGFNDPNSTVYVSEQVSFEYAKMACERFLEIHPEHREFLTNIIDNWKPLNGNTQF